MTKKVVPLNGWRCLYKFLKTLCLKQLIRAYKKPTHFQSDVQNGHFVAAHLRQLL